MVLQKKKNLSLGLRNDSTICSYKFSPNRRNSESVFCPNQRLVARLHDNAKIIKERTQC